MEHVRVGRAIQRVRDEQTFPVDGHADFAAWATKRLGCEEGQRNRLLAAGRIDPALVEHKRIALVKLAAVGTQPEWLHEVLVERCTKRDGEARLAWIAASALKHIEQHGDTAAALQHARAFTVETALVPPPRTDSLETLIKRLQTPLKGLAKAADEVLIRVQGLPLPEGSPAAQLLAAALLGLVPVILVLVALGRLVKIDLLAVCAGRVSAQEEAAPSPAGLKPEPEPRRWQPVTTSAPQRQRTPLLLSPIQTSRCGGWGGGGGVSPCTISLMRICAAAWPVWRVMSKTGRQEPESQPQQIAARFAELVEAAPQGERAALKRGLRRWLKALRDEEREESGGLFRLRCVFAMDFHAGVQKCMANIWENRVYEGYEAEEGVAAEVLRIFEDMGLLIRGRRPIWISSPSGIDLQ